MKKPAASRCASARRRDCSRASTNCRTCRAIIRPLMCAVRFLTPAIPSIMSAASRPPAIFSAMSNGTWSPTKSHSRQRRASQNMAMHFSGRRLQSFRAPTAFRRPSNIFSQIMHKITSKAGIFEKLENIKHYRKETGLLGKPL